MSPKAPPTRLVDQFTGEVAERPSQFFRALSEADALCAERNDVAELHCRVDELTAENADLAERLADLDEAHQVTLTWLAEARRELAAALIAVQTYRAALSVSTS